MSELSGPVLPPFAKPDYMLPSPHEVAKIGKRYTKTRGGNQSRTWQPSKQRCEVVRRIVYERDDFTCQTCGYQGDRSHVEKYAGYFVAGLTLDHIIPYRDGGLFYPDNLQTLCGSCNSREGAR